VVELAPRLRNRLVQHPVVDVQNNCAACAVLRLKGCNHGSRKYATTPHEGPVPADCHLTPVTDRLNEQSEALAARVVQTGPRSRGESLL
jgi:hypothetical protein